MTLDEFIERVQTVYWGANVALLSYARYKELLSNEAAFGACFPGVQFENPKIQHKVDEDVLLATTKNEMLAEHNSDLYKAWQIVSAISAMTSILEAFLKSTAEKITQKADNSMGIFYRFPKETGLDIVRFENYERLRHYYELRNISSHNLGRINERFKNKTAEQHREEGPYTFYPSQLLEYRALLEEFGGYVQEHS